MSVVYDFLCPHTFFQIALNKETFKDSITCGEYPVKLVCKKKETNDKRNKKSGCNK